MSELRAAYSRAARQSPPISFREYPSLSFDRNFPAASDKTLTPSSAALLLPAPFCFLDPVSARFQTPARPLPSCCGPRQLSAAMRAPQTAADIAFSLALFAPLP